MADNIRTLEVYLDVENSRQVLVDNFAPGSKMRVFAASQLIVRAHLRKADGTTYFQPPVGCSWLFVIDNNYTEGHVDPVVSENDQFNIPADWASLDVVNGKICFRVNTATTQLRAALGTDIYKPMIGELWMLAIGEDPSLLCQWQIDVYNVVGEVNDDSTLAYASSLAVQFRGDDVVLMFPDGSVAQRWTKV